MQQSGLFKTENGFVVFDFQPGLYSFSSQSDKPAYPFAPDMSSPLNQIMPRRVLQYALAV